METRLKTGAAARKISEVEGQGLVVSVWHNDGSSVSTLEKKTLKIYHDLEDLNYWILRIYTEFWKKICKKVLVDCQKSVWFKSFNTGEENTKDLLRSTRPTLWDVENIYRVLGKKSAKKC